MLIDFFAIKKNEKVGLAYIVLFNTLLYSYLVYVGLPFKPT